MSTLKVNNLQDLGADAVVTNGVIDPGAITSLNASALPTGSIVQVVNTSKTDAFTTTSTSYVDVTGLSATITPTSASNKILVLMSIAFGNSGNGGNASIGQVVRDATAIGNNATGRSFSMVTVDTGGNRAVETKTVAILDEPATTSATTYKVQVFAVSGTTATVNRAGNSSTVTSVSNITLMEVTA